jgi:hypothetical protein
MLKRFLPDDIRSSLRSNAIGVVIFVITAIMFVVGSFIVLRALQEQYSTMSSSSWVSHTEDMPDQQREADARYDLSQKGVQIPPSRDERLSKGNSHDAPDESEYYRRDCYEKAKTLEESDLCAQWSNAAAVRYGNRIALEAFWLNSWIGFLTAFGVFLAAVGVIFSGAASIHASRGVAMMAYGFRPALALSVQRSRAGWIRLMIRNVGTGPAINIRVNINGAPARLQQDRLGAGSHTVVDHQVDGADLKVDASCLDHSRDSCTFDQRFVEAGPEWVVVEGQP